MPIIPTLGQSPVTPNIPNPVLDTQRRPTVDTSGMQRAVGEFAQATKQPLLPGKELAAPYEALGSIGKAIQEGGSVMGALAIKRAETESYVQTTQADAKLDQTRQEFETWRAAHPEDPASWADQWKLMSQPALDEVLADPKLRQDARDKITLRGQLWQTKTSAAVDTAAATKTFDQGRQAVEGEIGNAIEAQDRKGFDSAVEKGRQMGLVYDWKVQHFEDRYAERGKQKQKEVESDTERAEFKAAAADAINDPLKWQADNKEPWKGKEILWQKVKNVSDNRINEGTQAAVQDVTDGIDSGELTVPAEIDELASKNPFLRPALVEKAKKLLVMQDTQAMRDEREQNGVRNAVALHHAVEDYDRAEDPEGVKYFELKVAVKQTVPAGIGNEISNRLDQKFSGQEGKLPVRPEIHQNITKTLDRIFDPTTGVIPWKTQEPKTFKYAADENHWFSADHKAGDPIIDPATKKPKVALDPQGNPRMEKPQVNAEAQQRAFDVQARVQGALDDWIRTNPEDAKDVGKVQKKVMELLPEGTRAGAIETLKKLKEPKVSAASGDLRTFVAADDLKTKLPSGLQSHAQDFVDAGREYGLNPRVLAAISSLETGGGTSKAFREKNNAMGISDNSGPRSMASVRDSIFRQAKTLADPKGPYAKARTIEEIGSIYAPPGASNDPNHTNSGWAAGVRSYLARL